MIFEEKEIGQEDQHKNTGDGNGIDEDGIKVIDTGCRIRVGSSGEVRQNRDDSKVTGHYPRVVGEETT